MINEAMNTWRYVVTIAKYRHCHSIIDKWKFVTALPPKREDAAQIEYPSTGHSAGGGGVIKEVRMRVGRSKQTHRQLSNGLQRRHASICA